MYNNFIYQPVSWGEPGILVVFNLLCDESFLESDENKNPFPREKYIRYFTYSFKEFSDPWGLSVGLG